MTQDIVIAGPVKPVRFRRGDLTRVYPELPDYLTPPEVHAIIEATRGKPRDCLLFNLLWHTGCRITEILNLTLDMIRPSLSDSPFTDLRIKGKGDKVRIVPIPGFLVAELYQHALRTEIEATKPLFSISRSQAHRLLTKYAAAAGITRPVHCHLFRHGFAVNFLRQTGNIVYLQDLLGHSSIETTRIYVRAALPDVREALGKVEF